MDCGVEGQSEKTAVPSPSTHKTVHFAPCITHWVLACFQIFSARGFIRNRLLQSRHSHRSLVTNGREQGPEFLLSRSGPQPSTLIPRLSFPSAAGHPAAEQSPPAPAQLAAWHAAAAASPGLGEVGGSAAGAELGVPPPPLSRRLRPGGAALADGWARPGPEGGAVGHATAHLQSAGPRGLRPAPARRLGALQRISVPASSLHLPERV